MPLFGTPPPERIMERSDAVSLRQFYRGAGDISFRLIGGVSGVCATPKRKCYGQCAGTEVRRRSARKVLRRYKEAGNMQVRGAAAARRACVCQPWNERRHVVSAQSIPTMVLGAGVTASFLRTSQAVQAVAVERLYERCYVIVAAASTRITNRRLLS